MHDSIQMRVSILEISQLVHCWASAIGPSAGGLWQSDWGNRMSCSSCGEIAHEWLFLYRRWRFTFETSIHDLGDGSIM